jgi:hypothetical protein
MATSVLANPLSTVALTQNQFAPQWEHLASSAAALTGPREHAFTFPGRTSTYHVVVTNTGPAPVPALPDWVEPTINAFVGIQNLTDNWNSYGGKAVNRDLINQSLVILGAVMQFDSPAPSVVPLGDGGLQIEWHRRQQDLEIAFTADDSPQFFYRNRATGLLEEGSARETEKLIRFVKDLI